jgi:hypothetical protein
VALIKNPNPKSFASGMVELTVNASRRRELGRQGRKLVEQIYNFAQFKLLLKNCYDKLDSR